MFCTVCGSHIVSLHKLAPTNVYLTLGCLDDSENIEETEEVLEMHR